MLSRMPITHNGRGQPLPFTWIARPPQCGLPDKGTFRALRPNPCWHCHWFEGLTEHGLTWCLNPGCSKTRAGPSQGCSAWEREPGADDEPGPPGVVMRIEYPKAD